MAGMSLRKFKSSVGAVITKIKMFRSSTPNLTCLLVEGTSDVTFFKNVVDDHLCKVISCDGKSNVIDVIRTAINQRLKGVVGIVDKDYDGFLNSSNEQDNLFETDANDMESMILKTKALKKLLNEYGDTDKISEIEKQWGYTFREHITRICSAIGGIRLANAKHDLGLNFKLINLADFIDNDYLLDETKYFETIVKESGKKGEKSEIKTRITECMNSCNQKWDLCRGHDLTEVIKIILASSGKNLGNSTAYRINNTNHFEQNVRIAYETSDFMKTHLFQKLVQWEEKNSPWILFDKELLN